MTLAEASRQMQCALEFHRADPEDEDAVVALAEAKAALFAAWMEGWGG